MRLNVPGLGLLLAIFSANTAAYIVINSFPSTVYIGNQYTVSWTASSNYSYNIWLVAQNPGNPYTWTNGSSLASSIHFDTLSPSFSWSVPTNLNITRFYQLWFDAYPQQASAASISNQTTFFAVSTGTPSSTGVSSTGTSSSTSTASSSATSSASSSSAASASSSPSSGSSSGSNSSLSGGAIAGIVIGILLVLGLIAGGYVLSRWRKKKSAYEKRQAAARASRLEPVMQAQSPSYEMHGRAPQANKETNV